MYRPTSHSHARVFGMVALLAAVVVSIGTAQSAKTPQSQLIQEAFRGELVYTQEAGELQLTAGSDVTRNRIQAPGTLSLGAEYGLTAAWQVSLEWQAPTFWSGNAPPSTMSAGIKRAWMRLGGSGLDLASGVGLTFPLTGPARTNLTELESFVVLAANPADGALHIFVGASLGVLPVPGDGDADEAAGLVWHAGVVARASQFRLTAELDRERHGEVCLTPGVVWRGSSAFQVGLAAPIGLTATGTRPQLIAKVTYELHGND